MNIHPKLEIAKPKEYQDAILKVAKKRKLNKINFEVRYDVVKQKSKKKNPYMDDSGRVISMAYVYLIGNETAVALWFSTLSEWFHTSEVIKCIKYKKYIKIETLNSVYKLYPWK